MTTKELIALLKTATPTARVYFSFCKCVPTTIDSWRGIYAEPALGWSPAGYTKNIVTYPTVSTLISELEKGIGGEFYDGWKGGSYSYTGDEELHIDNPGDYTRTKIESVAIKSQYEVIITTLKKD